MTKLGLALDAEISARRLSFLETGNSQPSREMVLHLCERLDVPLRERNMLLIAAGHAPVFAQRSLDDPALKPAVAAVEQVLRVMTLSRACHRSCLDNGEGEPCYCVTPRGFVGSR